MMDVVGQLLAGLALFFSGVSGIQSNLQQFTGRRFRRLLARWTQHPGLAAAWGCAFGAVTQSATAVSFILAGLIAGGTLTVPRALMIVGWANVGTALLVFLAAIDLHLAVLYLVGIAGLAVAFDVAPRLKPALAALFSVGLLFFGLNLMKQAFAPLPEFAWFHTAAEFARGSDLAATAFGLLLRTVIQSSSAIAVLAVVLSHAGLLTQTQIIMLIFGASIGVALSSYMLSFELKGVPRQIVLFHGGINGVSGLLCIGLAGLETITGWPLVFSWIAAAPGGADAQLSFAYLMVMLGAVGVAAISARHAPAWLTRWSPATLEQGLSQPRHLQDEALSDPDAALDLMEREQAALLSGLTAYLEAARQQRQGRAATVPPAVTHRAFAAIASAVQEFGTNVADQHMSHASSSTLLALERRLGLLDALNDNLQRFAVDAGQHGPSSRTGPAIDDLVEAIDLLLLTAIDYWTTHDEDDLATFTTMTEDRGTMMERFRRTYKNEHTGLAHDDEAALFHLTSLFERIVWLIRQIGLSLTSGPRAPGTSGLYS